MIFCQYQFHFSGFYFGQIKYVIDQRQKIAGRGFDITGIAVYFPASAFFHNDIAQSDNGVHRCADLMGHIGKKGTLGNVGLFCLFAHLFDFLNIISCFRHIQNQNDITLFFTVFIRNLLYMSLIETAVETEFFPGILVKDIMWETFQFFNMFSDGMNVQIPEDCCSRRIVADNPLVFVYCDNTVVHAVKQYTGRQTAEIVYLSAPDQNDHTGKNQSQYNRSWIIYIGQF